MRKSEGAESSAQNVAKRTGLKFFQVIHDFRARPFLRTDKLPTDYALAIDDVSFWERVCPVQIVRLMIPIAHRQQPLHALLGKFLVRIFIDIGRYRKHYHLVAQLLL